MTTQEILSKVASGDIQPSEAATLIAALNGNGYPVVIESKGEYDNTCERTVNASVHKEGLVFITAGEAGRGEL
ncbi:MAG: hypothetical protein HYV60_21220, partial [Planctomycetia bacterium]|nr:hypothetical protein [Planctomycetia bacterium]